MTRWLAVLFLVSCGTSSPAPGDAGAEAGVQAPQRDGGHACEGQGAVCVDSSECCPGLACQYAGGGYARCQALDFLPGVPPGYWERGCGWDACGGPLPVDHEGYILEVLP